MGAHKQFAMPDGLALSADESELFICDSGNGRIVVMSTDGDYLRQWGQTGRDLGLYVCVCVCVCVCVYL